MNTKQAISQLKTTISSLDLDKLRNLVTVCELGAGNVFMSARSLEDKRRSVIMELVDSVVYSTCDSNDEYCPDAEFIPVYSGSWELVLASLILADDWVTICDTARELRTESPRSSR